MRGCSLLASLFAAAAGLQAGEHELVAHMRLHNLSDFDRIFWDIATPGHPKYLQFLSADEVSVLIGASDDEIETARTWLLVSGAKSVRVSPLRDQVTAVFEGDASSTSHLLSSSLALGRPASVDFLLRREPGAGVAQAPRGKKALESETPNGYSIASIKEAYGMPADLQASNASTTQMVWGPGSFGYSKVALGAFKLSQCPLLNMGKVQFDTENHGHVGDNYMEGNLDVSMIASFGLNVTTLVSNTNASASTEEGQGFGQALLDFITELAARKTVPHVLSISLGSLSAYSCDLLCTEAEKRGHTLEECNDFLQNQRQVCMFLSKAQVARINTAIQVLGARGVTVLAASGDGGSHFSFEKFSGGAIASTLNEISCQFQMPVAPTDSPYLVAVGGEMWQGSSSHPVMWSTGGSGSGGGISWQFPGPEHQRDVVAAYLKETAGVPPASSYKAGGRAYPDMSAVGVQGTSQSCPVAAGIWSMIIDHRLNAGLPPLGFVAPRLWQVAQDYPSEAFFDISEGNTKCSCDNGFPVAKGWDAGTGWGRPVWEGMLKHFGSDSGVGRSAIVV